MSVNSMLPTKKKPTEQRYEVFCQEYIASNNASKAALKAGYSKKTCKAQGSLLLDKPFIRNRINELKEQRSVRTGINADYVLNKIKETIERCSQAVPYEEWNHSTKQRDPTGEWKFEHMGVLKGCELLGKHLALFTEKIEHSGKIELEKLSDDELDNKIAELHIKLYGQQR
jgi:phage terminase small subunit